MSAALPTRGRQVARRVADAPLWAHALALLVGLLVLLPIVGTQASYSADEGAAIIQARSLAPINIHSELPGA